MKAYVRCPVHLSQAMFRVVRNLERYAPQEIEFVSNARDAEFQVLHVIGKEAIETRCEDFAVIQYCYQTAGDGPWQELWKRARTVWSYYDLPAENLYLAPLGIDSAFLARSNSLRDIGVITSGYVSGQGAEAIEEMHIAASFVNMKSVHIGPDNVQGIAAPLTNARLGIYDSELAELYGRSRWVSGLRYVEGFELPVIEGLSCGARPIVFDRPDMRRWYDRYAVFVKERSGKALIEDLINILMFPPGAAEVPEHLRLEAQKQFDWKTIIEGFWQQVLSREQVAR